MDFTPDNIPNLLKQLEEFQKQVSEAKLPNVFQQLDAAQIAMQETHDSLTNPKKKQMLGELLGELAKARTECEKMVPDLEQEFKKQMQDLDRIKDLNAQLEQTEKALDDKIREEAEMAAAMQLPPAPEPDAPIDATLGADLAQELLGLLGMLEKVTGKGFEDAGSIARMWSETEGSEHGEGSPPAKSPPPAPVPAPTLDRPTLKPRSSKPLSRPRRDVKPPETGTTHDESIGRTPFEDE